MESGGEPASSGTSAQVAAAPGTVLLVSCYELGRQPFNIASPWAQLEDQGFAVDGVDTAIDALSDDQIRRARLVAISVPMHTALRLGCEVAQRIRRLNPSAHVCFFGMYASMNAEFLLQQLADSVIGGEFEVALVDLARSLRDGTDAGDGVVSSVSIPADGRVPAPPVLRKLPFVLPQRSGLAPPQRYASFIGPREGETRAVGYVEATRGCRHTCRHCPVTSVYQGRFFVVPRDLVLEDAAQQIALGAGHITFGDPDFFNGPKHGMAVARALHAAHPDVTFDVTIKVEHLLKHPELVKELGELGCAFIITAVESLSDRVLEELDKGHTRQDVFHALAISRAAGVPLRPSLVAFTPWTTLDDFIELVSWIARENLVDHIEPIQLAIRLLIPPGSAMLWQDGQRDWLGPLSPENFGYTWTHPDPRMDRLHREVSEIVEASLDVDPSQTVAAIHRAAYAMAGKAAPALSTPLRSFVPRLSEGWFCCAEPNQRQFESLKGGCS